MSPDPQKVNVDAAPQPPVRGGFIRLYRDELPKLYDNKNAAVVLLWIKDHAAFVPQEVNRRGELIKVAPGECVFSLLDLQKSLGLTPKEARYALEYLNKNELIRIVTTKNYSKAIFPESIGWAACAKYMCKIKRKKNCTKRGTDGGTLEGTDQGMDQGTDEGTLLDKNNDAISYGYDKNGDLRGTDQGTDRGIDQGTDQGADEGKAGAHIGPETPGPPELPAPKNSEESEKKESLSSSKDERDFWAKFLGKEKEIEAVFFKKFSQHIEIVGKKQLKGALWVIFKAGKGKKWDDPLGMFWTLAKGKGYIGKFDKAWCPFSPQDQGGYIPPKTIQDLATVEKSTPESIARIKAENEAKRKAAQDS